MRSLIIIILLVLALMGGSTHEAAGQGLNVVYVPLIIRPYTCADFPVPVGDADSVVFGATCYDKGAITCEE